MQQPEAYHTISTEGEGLYKEKGSKFIAHAYHVRDEEEVSERLEELRKTYHDARHHCYAYVLNPDRNIYRANDDGEPNHSAGDPILGQINSKQLTDVLVVVIRYFGGTKLGVSGLINAYKTAAEAALNQAKITKVDITETIQLQYSYEATNEVMRLIDEFELQVINQEFTANCTLKAAIKIGKVKAFKERIQLLIDTHHEVKLA